MSAWIFASLLALSPLDTEAPCRGCAKTVHQREENLYVFISFSVPIQTWQEYSQQLTKSGGIFLLRGIPGNSFEQLALKIVELRKAGVYAPIDIDPEFFAHYQVESVPALVLKEKGKFDKISGNLRLDSALKIIAESGDGKETASSILEKIQ